jgi:hypothetical protein
MSDKTEPRRGSLAYCSKGYLGLITCDKPQPVGYEGGGWGVAWTGIHLSEGKIGDPWSSRNPVVAGHILDLKLAVTSP